MVIMKSNEPLSRVRPSIADGQSPTYIGTRGDYYSFYDGYIAEIMIFNTALTGTNLNNVRQYLAAKYGFVLVAPGPTAPLLSIARQGASLVISWPQSYTSYILQGAANLAGSWTMVAGAQSN